MSAAPRRSSPHWLSLNTRPRKQRHLKLLASFLFDRLNPAGRAVFTLLLLGAMMGQNLALPISRLFAFALTALVVAAASSWLARPPLSARRLQVPHASAGGALCYDVEVENLSTWRIARDLSVLEFDLPPGVRPDWGKGPELIPALKPGERVVVAVRLRCMQRGSFELKRLAVTSTFPLGMWRSWCASDQVSSFLVYPVFTTPDEVDIPSGTNYQPGGILLSSEVGESSEFMHVREWREGDNPRHVHWASTARLGHPVVKVYHEEYFVRLALALDTEVPAGVDHAAFEWALSTAAGLADALSRKDYILDIFAAGATVHRFQAGRALAHLDHVLELLACLEPTTDVDWEALGEALVPEAPRLTGLVAIFLDWTEERARLVANLSALGVGVRVFVVKAGNLSSPAPSSDPASFLHVYPGNVLDVIASHSTAASGAPRCALAAAS